MSKTDVLVCGGGPAGLAAAIAVRRQGMDVVVVDCFKPQVDKACGEGLMPDGLEALAALGVVPSEEETGVFAGIRFVDRGRSVEARFPRGVGRGIRRTTLHNLLHKRAEGLGVRFCWSTPVLNVRDGVVQTGRDEIQTKWVVGADGLHSRIREWAGLGQGRRLSRRIGLRQHFRVQPWGDFMEVHWSKIGQAYVTPISKEEICVVVVAQQRPRSVCEALFWFPELAARLKGVETVGAERGALTEGHIYERVTADRTALIGDASCSVDAIAGQGLALSFLQAAALGVALGKGDLRGFEEAHRRIRRVPVFMSRTMLLMDRFQLIRHGTLAAFQMSPWFFERMLSVHVGQTPLAIWGKRRSSVRNGEVDSAGGVICIQE